MKYNFPEQTFLLKRRSLLTNFNIKIYFANIVKIWFIILGVLNTFTCITSGEYEC